jgi:hypothetical protein
MANKRFKLATERDRVSISLKLWRELVMLRDSAKMVIKDWPTSRLADTVNLLELNIPARMNCTGVPPLPKKTKQLHVSVYVKGGVVHVDSVAPGVTLIVEDADCGTTEHHKGGHNHEQ